MKLYDLQLFVQVMEKSFRIWVKKIPVRRTNAYAKKKNSAYDNVKTQKGGVVMSGGYGGGFALIVVLFILLIIVGAAWIY